MRGNSSKQDTKGMSHATETSTRQIAMTEPRANTTRSPPRPTRRHRRGGTGKSATGKQAGGDARHAIITTARTSTDPEGGGLV